MKKCCSIETKERKLIREINDIKYNQTMSIKHKINVYNLNQF